MIIGLLQWIITGSFILGLAYLLYRWLKTDRISINLVIYAFLVIYTGTLFMLLMGLIGQLRGWALTIVALLGWAIILISTRIRHTLKEIHPDLRKCTESFFNFWQEMNWWLRLFSGIAILASIARFSFLVITLPPFVWDSLTYHLTNIAQWTQQGRIGIFNTPINRIYLPANYEVFTTWFTVFLQHDVLIEASGIVSYALAAIAVFAIGRSLNLSRQVSWIGSMAFATTPGFLLATTGTKNDPMMVAMILSALAIIINLIFQNPNRPTRNLIGEFSSLLFILLYALGTKAYIIHVLPGMFVILLLGLLVREWRKNIIQAVQRAWREFKGLPGIGKRQLFLLAAGAAFLGGYWYLRNLVLTGNPFYPYGVQIGDLELISGTKATFPLKLDRLSENLKSFIEKFGDRRYNIIPALHETTGWGWFFYGLGLPVLVWGILRDRRIRLLSAGFLTAFLVMFLSTRPSPWNMRYLTWMPAISVIAFMVLLEKIESYTVERFLFILLFMICAGLNFLNTINYHRITFDQFKLIMQYPVLERDAAKLHVYVPYEYQWALENVPNDEVLGYSVHNNGFVYPLYRADFSQMLAYIPVQVENGACSEVIQEMRSRGTSWLFLPKNHSDDKVRQVINGCIEEDYLINMENGLYKINEYSK